MAKKRKPQPSSTVLNGRVQLRISEREKRAFQEAAARYNLSLSHWLRLAAWQIVHDHDGRVKLVDLED